MGSTATDGILEDQMSSDVGRMMDQLPAEIGMAGCELVTTLLGIVIVQLFNYRGKPL